MLVLQFQKISWYLFCKLNSIREQGITVWTHLLPAVVGVIIRHWVATGFAYKNRIVNQNVLTELQLCWLNIHSKFRNYIEGASIS
jgi:hypothetical protein